MEDDCLKLSSLYIWIDIVLWDMWKVSLTEIFLTLFQKLGCRELIKLREETIREVQ